MNMWLKPEGVTSTPEMSSPTGLAAAGWRQQRRKAGNTFVVNEGWDNNKKVCSKNKSIKVKNVP